MLELFVSLLLAAPAFAATSAVRSVPSGANVACAKFKLIYPEQTFYPGSAGYIFETQSGMSTLSIYHDT